MSYFLGGNSGNNWFVELIYSLYADLVLNSSFSINGIRTKTEYIKTIKGDPITKKLKEELL